jgi:uncharacterized protein (DUF885 family)
MKRFLLGFFALVIAAAALFLVPTVWFQPWSVNHFYTRTLLVFLLRHPETLTQVGILNGVPGGSWRDRLDDYSISGELSDQKLVREDLDRLHRYDRSRMKPGDQLSYDTMNWFLTDMQGGEKFRLQAYPLNQMFGFQSSLPDFMLNTQPLKTPRDAESYLKRLAAFGPAFDQTIERVKERDRAGVMPPRFVLREVREQMERFVAKPSAQNELVTHFAAKAESIRGLDEARRKALEAQVQAAVEQTVYPAYARMIALVKDQESRATDQDGVWKLPHGDEFYAYVLRHFTTTDLPPDTIHALGLHELARLQKQMTPLLDEVGVKGRGFGERMHHMRDDPRFGFPAGDSGRALIMARYHEILDDASARCDSLFGLKPKAKLTVERLPAFKEATSPAAYYNGGAFDRSRPGTFFVNLRDPTHTRRPDMRTLAYHEGIPGHHFQISIQQELTGVPMFRKMIPFTAYAEGWGLYAERVGLEHGFHRDAYDSLGALGAELFRAVRLVVDTGIHRERWTRQQAIDYMVTNTGMDTAEVVSEIERYIVLPGQACAYKVGQLEILALRQRAEDRLGPRFDLRKFHDVILGNGSLPLTLLDRVVNDWIERELNAARVQGKG